MFVICLMLATAPADLRATIDSYLGTIERPVGAARWQALGPDAIPILREIAEGNGLPTQRAQAVTGLAAIGGNDAPALLASYSLDEKQAFPVRMAAVHGLARMSSDSSLRAALEPVLKAKDARVSATAAQLLAKRSPASCSAIRQRGAKDEHFSRALAACAK
jgi:HEAT repeat protein